MDLGARSLRTQRQGVELAGQNLANVNNPAYARQRLNIQTSTSINTGLGPQGTGVTATGIQQIRDTLVDKHILGETSVTSFLEAKQRALETLQHGLGERFTADALNGAEGIQTSQLSTSINEYFSALQGLSASPASLTARQSVNAAGQKLASGLNGAFNSLQQLGSELNNGVTDGVKSANELLQSIATLNKDISDAEGASGGVANDFRDARQQKLEELAKLVNFETSTDTGGNLNVAVGGQLLVSGRTIVDRLQSFDSGAGVLMVRAEGVGTPVSLTSGSIQGAISARDEVVAGYKTRLNAFAGELSSAVNTTHRPGYNLAGGTGADFFVGTDAASIKVNDAIRSDPRLLQASGASGEAGNNVVALALAQLQDAKRVSLGGQTFGEAYSGMAADLARDLSSANDSLGQQQIMENYLKAQRASLSGVSIDEEMTDLVRFEKAFQASAKLIATLSEMLEDVVNLKR